MSDAPTVTSTPTDSGVNLTPGIPTGVNAAPASPSTTTEQILNTSALIAQYEQRINRLMSEKDKSIHERNQAITQLTDLQQQFTALQEQTQSSLSAAANAAQQSIERAKTFEQQLTLEQAKNSKLAALMQRPHLAPYADLIPTQADEAGLTAALDRLEQIRQHDLDQYARSAPPPTPMTPATPASPASTLQNLYGNRANMNPALFQGQPIPGSSPAQMNPQMSTTPVQGVEAIFAEAKRVGTAAAFEEAVVKAAAFAASITY